MSKQVLLNQAVLEFRGCGDLPCGITQALKRKLGRADWTELLKPLLQGIPAEICIVDVSGPERTARQPAKAGRSRKKRGHSAWGSPESATAPRTFEFSDITAEEAARIFLEQTGIRKSRRVSASG